MHIADITMFYGPQSGGVKRYLHAKRDWLASRPAFRHSLLVPGPLRSAVAPETVSLFGILAPGAAGYRIPVESWRAAAALRELQPDVIEVGDPFVYAFAALHAGRELGVPVIAFCHCDVLRVARRIPGRPAAQAVGAYLRWLYAQFDAVLAASNVVEESLVELGLRNVARQPLGVDTRVFRPDLRDASIRRTLGLTDDAHLLIYAGRYAAEKNLWVLEQAMQRLGSRYILITVGSGPRPARGGNILHLPYQSDPAQLARLLASCDAFVHPGDQETFGLVVLEAMACGLPVIGTDSGAVRELIDPDVGITVPPLQPAALAEAIQALFQRDRPAMAAAARQRAVGHHDWDAVMPGLIGHYRAALARRGAPESAQVAVGDRQAVKVQSR